MTLLAENTTDGSEHLVSVSVNDLPDGTILAHGAFDAIGKTPLLPANSRITPKIRQQLLTALYTEILVNSDDVSLS